MRHLTGFHSLALLFPVAAHAHSMGAQSHAHCDWPSCFFVSACNVAAAFLPPGITEGLHCCNCCITAFRQRECCCLMPSHSGMPSFCNTQAGWPFPFVCSLCAVISCCCRLRYEHSLGSIMNAYALSRLRLIYLAILVLLGLGRIHMDFVNAAAHYACFGSVWLLRIGIIAAILLESLPQS